MPKKPTGGTKFTEFSKVQLNYQNFPNPMRHIPGLFKDEVVLWTFFPGY